VIKRRWSTRRHIIVPCRAVGGLTERNGFHVYHAGEGGEVLARTVMLVLGVQYRRLPVRSIEDYEGLGVADATASAGGNAFHVSHAPSEERAVDLKLVRQAMREQRKLLIAYRDPKGARSERVIWPIALGFFESRRIIAGWCELRNDFRSFRADRIEQATLRAARYPGRRHDLVKQWRSQVADEKGRKPRTTK
jgi:hypothetical protein